MLNEPNQGVGAEQITLQFYGPAFKKQVEDYVLTEEQLRYTAHPAAALSLCEQEDDRHPILILQQDRVAGFFVLHGWTGVQAYSSNEHAILLRAYSIQHSCQGKGIATQSLRLLPSFVKTHFADKNEIVLAVNEQNTAAQTVYKKIGFVDKGLRLMGRTGLMYMMHLDL